MRERKRVTHPEGGRVLTKQSMAAETDVNAIMARHVAHGTGVLHVNHAAATYGDFSSGLDYASALNQIMGAQRDFERLPAEVRAHVENDPGKFLAMVFDPERRDELEGLGLVDPREPEGDPEGGAGLGGPAIVETPVVVDGEPKAVPQGEN